MPEKSNKAVYREMSVPFASPDACNEAINAFFNELSELRRKHKIRDLICVLNGSVLYPKDETDDEGSPEGEFIIEQSFGSSMQREVLAAWLLGHVQAEHRETVNKMLSAGGEKRKKPAKENLFD